MSITGSKHLGNNHRIFLSYLFDFWGLGVGSTRGSCADYFCWQFGLFGMKETRGAFKAFLQMIPR